MILRLWSGLRQFPWGVGILVTLAYLVSGLFGAHWVPTAHVASAIWFASGVGLVAVYQYGNRMCLAIFLGSILLGLSLSWMSDPFIFAQAAGKSLEAYIAVAILRRADFSCAFNRFRDLILFGFASVVSAGAGAAIGSFSLYWLEDVNSALAMMSFYTWLLGDVIGDLTFGIPLLLWFSRGPVLHRFSRVESTTAYLIVMVAAFFVFDFWADDFSHLVTRAYFLFPIVFWIAYRMGPIPTSRILILITVFAGVSTLQGFGPFATVSKDSVGQLQVFLIVMALTGMSVASVIAERRLLEARITLMSELGRVLSGPAPFEEKVNQAAQLCVPLLADWCIIDLVENGDQFRRVAIAAANPSHFFLFEPLKNSLPKSLHAQGGTSEVARTGQIVLIERVTEDHLKKAARNQEHLELLQKMNTQSCITIPMQARGQILGTVMFLTAESGRRFSKEDLAFAQELERRMAGAIDSARLLDEAQRANKAKDDFLAALSHELRTPLNVILGWIQILQRETVSENLRAPLETLERNAQIQVRLINDLLDVSRIVAGKFLLEKKSIVVENVINDAIESAQMEASKKSIQIGYADPKTNERHLVYGDNLRLQQAIGNLLVNAVKFTPEHGKVVVFLSVDEAKGLVSVSVKDNGRGIEPRFLASVFEAFKQEEGPGRSHGGLGLGLNIVKHIVEEHGGSVSVASPGRDQGSEFTICLPLEKRETTEIRKTTQRLGTVFPSSQAVLTGLRILLVDDSPDLLMLITHWLKRSGADVSTASSAMEGFKILREARPDVVLSDIGMPEHDGYQLIKWIRELPPHEGGSTPVAAITAYAREEEERKVLRAGFQMHLPKPIKGPDLIEAVLQLHQTQFVVLQDQNSSIDSIL